jgi:hypothetical protein
MAYFAAMTDTQTHGNTLTVETKEAELNNNLQLSRGAK